MKVLFATDGSKISYQALDNFCDWAKDITVDILSVADLGVVPDNTSLEASEFAMYCTKSVDKILNYTEDYLNEREIKINQKNKMCGSVADSILELEDTYYYDAIILGSNGKRGIQKWLGSVSGEMASSSKTSVYISKRRNLAKKVLFTVDSSQESLDTITKAVKLLNFENKIIHLVTVYEMPDYIFLEGKMDNNWVGDIEKQQQKSANSVLAKVEKIFNENGVFINSKNILKGHPAQEIIKYCSSKEIDLVVTGMRKRKYLSRFILGSVSKRVLENVVSDCFIVK